MTSILARGLFVVIGSLIGTSIALPLLAGDWPMWRHDAMRTSSADEEVLAEKLYPQWSREMAAPRPAWTEDVRIQFDASYEPIVVGQTMFIASAQNDSVSAVDTRTGDLKWRFFAEGPVRFAPVTTKGKVFFGADDGQFYCVDADSGELVWQFNAAPSPRKLLGNERLISVWPIRGGPVLHEGRIHFSAGVWPFEGAFLYSFDVPTDDVQPEMDVATLPTDHLPQSYLSAVGARVFIPSGRGPALQYDLANKDFMKLQYDSKGLTDYHVTLSGQWLFHGDRVYNTNEHHGTTLVAHHPVTSGDLVFTGLQSNAIACSDLTKSFLTDAEDDRGKPIKKRVYPAQWHVDSTAILDAANATPTQAQTDNRLIVSIRAGDRLYGHWGDIVFAIDIPTDGKTGTVSWATKLDSVASTMIAADSRLFVATHDGDIHCFGPEKSESRMHTRGELVLKATPLADRVRHLLDQAGVNDGYCIVLGVGSGQLIDELLRQSELRLIVIEADEHRVRKLRRRFDDSELYGTRITACHGDFADFAAPPYMANLIVTEDLQATGFELNESFAHAVFAALRPYGGTAIAALSDDEHQVLSDLVWDLPNAVVKRDGDDAILVRTGALEGSADWTEEYGNPANSLVSKDQLVKPPFGVLWFGGPSAHPDLFYDRHLWSPSVTIVDGRMFMEGPERLTTVDVYTGRILWQRKLKQGLSPGRRANWKETGFHLVAASDAVYLTYETTCLVLNPATGELVTELKLESPNDQFGRIRVHDDMLIVSVFRQTDKGHLPVKLVAINRYDGEVIWERESISAFPFVALSDARVFAFEGHLEDLYENKKRKGEVPKASELKQLLAFDIRTGDQLWSGRTDRVVTWLAYSDETDMLVASNKLGVEGWQATKGEKIWDKSAEGVGFRGHPENLWDKVVLWKDQVIDQRGPGKSYDIRTGEPALVAHPITGEQVQWEFTKQGHHCGYAIGCENLVTFRAGDAAYLDMESGGTTHLKGFRSGCRNSLVPANGVLCAPNFADECICSYSIFTSLALVHVPEAEKWSYSAFKPLTSKVDRMGINFGAPGDRRERDGALWLDFPSVGGSSPDVQIQVDPNRPRTFRNHASMMEGDGISWVAASGVEGLSSLTVSLGEKTDATKPYTLRFTFAEPDDHQPGDRVFSVSAGDEQILKDVDIVYEAGDRRRILVKECRGVMANGELKLSFDAKAGEPLICGLEVIAEDAAP